MIKLIIATINSYKALNKVYHLLLKILDPKKIFIEGIILFGINIEY